MCKKIGLILVIMNFLFVPVSTQAAPSLDTADVDEYVSNYIEKMDCLVQPS